MSIADWFLSWPAPTTEEAVALVVCVGWWIAIAYAARRKV